MISDNIKYYRKRARYSQEQIARKLGLTQGSVSSWETGRNVPDTQTLIDLASILGIPLENLISDEPRRELDSVRVIRNAVPILGNIACGQRITPDTTPDGYADLPDGVHADFALRCKGDSMAPTFLDGDLVLIRQQPEVEPGQIAAVNIDSETTLKRVYLLPDGINLIADNPQYPPVFVPASSDREIIIHGLAVGYTRIF
jgi:repressor LexA